MVPKIFTNERLISKQRILADIWSNSANKVVKIELLHPKLGEVEIGANISFLHPVFYGAFEVVKAQNEWYIPLLEWKPPVYVAIQLKISKNFVNTKIFDFSNEAKDLACIQQFANELQLKAEKNREPLASLVKYKEDILLYLELLLNYQEKVVDFLNNPDCLVSDQGEKCKFGRLLHADDDIVFAKLSQAILSPKSTSYTWAVDGQKAVEAFENERYDVVVLDYDMPIKNGLDTANEINKIAFKRREPLPVLVFLSSWIFEPDQMETLQGMFTLVLDKSKVFEIDEALSALLNNYSSYPKLRL
jgi:CheY-like chemotaxis protein